MSRTPGSEMPFLEHLEELRWRIIWSLAAVAVGVAVAFVLAVKVDIIGIIQRPIAPYLANGKLVFTHPGDPFSIVLSIAFALGLMLALPVILYQLWAFVAPALYRAERRLVLPVIAGAIALFLAGVSLAYFVVLPLAVRWLMGFQTASLQPMITAKEYFDFALSMALAFGVTFELPVVIVGLVAVGVVTPQLLNRYRRHAIVACVLVGAFLTPGDLIWTTIAMSVPLYLLYELSVALAYVVHRRRARRAAGEGPPTTREVPA